MKRIERKIMKTQHQRKVIKKIENILFFPFKKRNWLLIPYYIKSIKKLNEIYSQNKHKNFILGNSINFYGTLYQRPQHMSMNLSQLGYFYFYGEYKNSSFIEINENLVVSNFALFERFFKKLEHKPFLYISSTDSFSYKELLQFKKDGYKIIYDYIDEMSEEIHDTEEAQKIYDNLEKINPVLILTTAKRLYNQMIGRFPEDRVLLSQNAVHIEDFERQESIIPEDMKKIVENGKPIVGYYGAVASWLNYDLLNQLSEQRPDYNFVYIGCDYNKGLSCLEQRDNVFYLGAKDYKKLVNYSKLFDIAIIPFKDGDIAKSTSPLKLFEYMAVKKPVVCTKDLHECYGYEGVFISSDKDDFINNVDKAISISKDEVVQNKIYEYAKENTWRKRAIDLVEKLECKKNF